MHKHPKQVLMVKIQRIDDQRFVFVSKKTNQHVILNINDTLENPEFRYNLAQKIANSISSGKLNKTYLLGTKKWEMSKDARTPALLRRLRPFSTMIHQSTDDNVFYFKVEEVKTKAVTGIHDAAIAQTHRLKTAKNIEKINFENCSLTISDFQQQIRAIVKLEGEEKAPLFSDAFTKMATLAFQKHEKEFTSKDYFLPEHCDFVIVKKNNLLLLVNKKNREINNATDGRATVKFYKEYLIQQYGKEKIAYIEHMYRMNLDEADALTPEHIYRFNMGVNNLEVQDIDDFLIKCHQVLNRLDPFNGDLVEGDFDRMLSPGDFNFTGREIYGLAANEIHTIDDLKDWLYELAPLPEISEVLSPGQMQAIMRIFKLAPSELNNAYTGRKIYKFIISGYTNAGSKEYKPWIDQQQLLQTLAKMEGCNNELEYQEKLAFVLAKNNLVREHPLELFRVGAIIPGLKDVDGSEHYYKVASFVSNSYGIVSLTLEKVCDDPDLSGIKAFRSTAASDYSLQAYESLLQDFFLVSSPGYKGTGLSDPYEREFFDARSIPIWVGYMLLEQDEKDPQARYNYLEKANLTLREEFDRLHEPKDLKTILKTNPFIEEILLRDETFWGPVQSDFDANLMSAILNMLDYVRENKNKPPNHSREEKLVNNFLKELKLFPLEDLPQKLQIAEANLRKELTSHITTQASRIAYNIEERKLKVEIIKKLQKFKSEAKDALKKGNILAAEKVLDKWGKALEKHAEKKGELLSEKTYEDICLTGHSLGGALVQSQFAHFLSNRMRIPLPGKAVKIFEFDAPGIEEDDNTFAKQMLLQHAEMLKKLGVGFHEFRRQEAGDIVPMSGKEHLFAANNFLEEKQLEDCGVLFLDQAIRRRLAHATTSAVSQAQFAHETQFGEGKRQRTFLGEQEEYGDYIETYYTPFIQKLFDHAGKVGTGPTEIKQNEESFKRNFKRLWNLSSLRGMWTPDSAERLRTWPGLPTLMIRKAIFDSLTEDRSLPYQDENGVFAVSENGLESQ